MNLYEFSGLKQVFAGRTVLDIDRLKLDQGQSYALLGPNGCGKTTLLHILAFLRPPFAGEMYFQGKAVQWREKEVQPLRKQVVLVDQHPIMFTTTVLKNVEYGPRMRKVPAERRRSLALECLDLVGMKEFAHRPAHLLSGGETQRVAIARALACQPEVMLFDEPTASVDVENQRVIESVIKNIYAEKKITIIFSTHKRMEASRLGEKKIFMFEGRLTGPGGENLVFGEVRPHGQESSCILGERVRLRVNTDITGRCRAFIKPEGINIYTLQEAEQAGQADLVQGSVLQMTAESGEIKVLLDAGIRLRGIMSRERAKKSGIYPGDKVMIGFEPDATYMEAQP
ncbi:MAG: ABC transporter ATP-binding protein [Desulfonatronovibrio sp.]